MNVNPKKQREQYESIYFIKEDFHNINQEYDDLMVISVLIHNFLMKQILVN